MSYLPIILVGIVGLGLLMAVWVMPRRRHQRQQQTIDRDPVPPRGGVPPSG